MRLAARRAHVALPPDRITKAGLPTSGPRGRCCWPKSRSTATRDHPETHRRNWEPGNPAWCTRTMQQLEEEGLFRAQEQEERREYGLARRGERMGALTGPRSSQTPWEGVARARTTPQLGRSDRPGGCGVRARGPHRYAPADGRGPHVLAHTPGGNLYRILGDRDTNIDINSERSERS